MSKELMKVFTESLERCRAISERESKIGFNEELNSLWWFNWEKAKAAQRALMEHNQMHWKTSGDFSHLQSTGAMSFGRNH